MGRLTTHVLDTAAGRPAAGVGIALYRLDGEVRTSLVRTCTNADGRVEAPLLEGPAFAAGVYELHFAIGDYYAAQGQVLPEPRFVDVVVLRFGVSDASAHYHVPLLVTPWSWSTYRGS